VIVVGRGSSVRRLLDGDGGGGGEDVVAELVALGHAVVALVARNDDAAAERVTRPLARGRVRLIVLRGDEPQVAERQRADAGRRAPRGGARRGTPPPPAARARRSTAAPRRAVPSGT
jgi:hypothetical protein